jgi:hypothetical protein
MSFGMQIHIKKANLLQKLVRVNQNTAKVSKR